MRINNNQTSSTQNAVYVLTGPIRQLKLLYVCTVLIIIHSLTFRSVRPTASDIVTPTHNHISAKSLSCKSERPVYLLHKLHKISYFMWFYGLIDLFDSFYFSTLFTILPYKPINTKISY